VLTPPGPFALARTGSLPRPSPYPFTTITYAPPPVT